jgi:uncharacterized protein (TIGR03790 family)
MRTTAVAGFVAFSLIVSQTAASGQSAENVAVVINQSSPASRTIGEHYVRTRRVPQANVIRLETATGETIERAAYIATIEQPIAAVLEREQLQDRILYIVLTKGIPLRISGTGGTEGTVSSVDSELTLLYRRMTGVSVPVRGPIDNPYYLGSRGVSEAKPFTHREHDIYLVTRLDAFTVNEAVALVDKAAAPSTEGRIVLDQQNKLFNRAGEDWLEAAADRLAEQGHGARVILEKTASGARDVRPVLGYYSWGSNDPRNQVRRFDMGLAPGSLAAMFVSSDGRTFQEPPAAWTPSGDWTDRSGWFGGSPQSLIGDLIREGATGVAGHVTEPYLQSTIRPQILFPAYLAGRNLVESFYLAMPHLSWQTIVIGDPLCAPFASDAVSPASLDSGTDPATELPAFFAKRRLAIAAQPGSAERAVALTLRAESRLARGDLAGARVALVESVQLAPQVAATHLQLALLDEKAGRHDQAIEGYRQVLKLNPRNAVALNNLAYRLAADGQSMSEAKLLAERALALAPGNATILDTLGWIEYLSGNHAAAVRVLSGAAKGAPDNAEIRLHAAFAHAAAGAVPAARVELEAALTLDPRQAEKEDVAALRRQLGLPSK